MQTHLFFICPTDYLESTICREFKSKCLFISSLGNSLSIDEHMVGQLNALIETQRIQRISFILSDSNQIFKELLDSSQLGIKNLQNFQEEISTTAMHLGQYCQSKYLIPSLIKNHLKTQASQLRKELQPHLDTSYRVDNYVYNRKKAEFHPLKVSLEFIDYQFCLN